MPQSSITIGVLLGASFIFGILLGTQWSEIFGLQEPEITTRPGVLLDDVIVAFGDEGIKMHLASTT